MSTPYYVLNRDYASNVRLNAQHALWTRLNGYLVHPAIPVPPKLGVTEASSTLGECYNIADIGTGTGAWILDVAASLPEDKILLHGYDVDLAQTPHAAWLPSNVKMKTLDIFDECLPIEAVGFYDLIHLRFLICVVSDPAPILRRLLRMLKPGGWVQWTENNPLSMRVETAVPNIQAPRTEELLGIVRTVLSKNAGRSPGWVADLSETFKSIGLTSVRSEVAQKASWELTSFHENILMAFEEVSLHTEEGGNRIRAAVANAAKELQEHQRGIAIAGDSVTVIGRIGGTIV